MKEEFFLTKSSKETQELAARFAQNLKGGNILLLFGNLGSGKTTFVQGLAKSLGIKERIISPTFIIVREHKLDNGKFYHVDLYRVQTKTEIENLGFDEIFSNPNNIVAIEWAENLSNLPEKRTEIYFEHISENKRKITIKKHG